MKKPAATASYETILKERDFLLSQCGRLKMEVESLNNQIDQMEQLLSNEKQHSERVRAELGALVGAQLS